MCAEGIVHPQASSPMKVRKENKSHELEETDEVVQDVDFAVDLQDFIFKHQMRCSVNLVVTYLCQIHGYARHRRRHTATQKVR